MGTDGRLPPSVTEGCSLLPPPFGVVASVLPDSFSCFDSLFFPPIPAETSAKTLSGSPFSFLAFLEAESSSITASSPLSKPPSFFGEAVFTLVLLFAVSSESAEADTAT